MDIMMYLVLLSVGFGLGIVCSLSLFLQRLEKLKRQDIAAPAPAPQVHVNVSAELVARYLDSFNLIAIPKDLVISPDEQVTKH